MLGHDTAWPVSLLFFFYNSCMRVYHYKIYSYRRFKMSYSISFSVLTSILPRFLQSHNVSSPFYFLISSRFVMAIFPFFLTVLIFCAFFSLYSLKLFFYVNGNIQRFLFKQNAALSQPSVHNRIRFSLFALIQVLIRLYVTQRTVSSFLFFSLLT